MDFVIIQVINSLTNDTAFTSNVEFEKDQPSTLSPSMNRVRP